VTGQDGEKLGAALAVRFQQWAAGAVASQAGGQPGEGNNNEL
jgi:hypothetical protein